MSDYWQKRAIKAEKKVNDGAKQLEDVVAQAYRQAQSYFNRQISKLFNRVKQQTKLSEDDARELLNQTVSVEELVELKRLAKDITQPELQKQAQNRLTALAVKSRITRVEELKAKSYLVSKQLADVQLQKQTDFYIDTIHGSYREATAETVIRKAVDDSKNGVITESWNKEGYKLKELSTSDTKNILDSHWKGSNYSERLWNDTDALAKRLEELFTIETLTGMSEFEMAQTVSKEFDRSLNVAKRLIRTEANYMANQAKLKSWKDNGVKQYMIIAILDLRTSQICQHKDHQVYLVSEAVVDGAEGTYPPFHPWCRSIASYYSKRLNNTPRKAVDPITGKTFDIKGSTTYNEWMDILKSKYSQEELLLHKKKVSNYEKDKAQFNNLKSTLGKENGPHSLEEYQEIKYNNSKEWSRLRDNFFVKSRLKDGRYSSTINLEKQLPHMKSTVSLGKSYFNKDIDVQELFDRYAGTGTLEKDRAGRRRNTEVIYLDKPIGIEASTGELVDGIKIHHSKKRTHLVPVRRKE